MSFNTTLKVLMLLAFCFTLMAQNPPAQRVVVVTDTAVATDDYTGCPDTTITSYVTGMEIRFLPATDNQGAATINICALGALAIKRLTGLDPDDGDIKANKYVRLVYDGTNLQIVSPIANNPPQFFRWTLDGGGSVLTTATSSALKVDKACTIREALLDADQSGSVTVTVEKATYTTGSPTYSTISSSFLLSSARSLKDTTLTSWTTALSADDLIRVNITGTPATITKATVLLRCF